MQRILDILREIVKYSCYIALAIGALVMIWFNFYTGLKIMITAFVIGLATDVLLD